MGINGMTNITALGAPAVPVARDLFRGEGRGARLVGSRCQGCGSSYFPRALGCRNPACDQSALQETLLGQHGVLYSYTVQTFRPPPLFRMDDWAPYAIGLVELADDRIRVLGMLGGCPLEQLRIGMALEMDTRTLYRDAQGQAVLTYQFVPRNAQAVAA